MILLGIFIFILNFSLGLFVILKKRGLISVIFGLFAMSFGMWTLSIFLTVSTTEPLFWGRLAFLTAIFGIGFIFLFALIFPEGKKISNLKLFLFFSPALILGLASFTDPMIKSVSVENYFITGTFGPLMQVYQVFAPIYIFGSILILLRKYLKSSNRFQKLQLKYTLLGVALFVGPAFLTNAVLPLWFNIYKFNTLGPLFSVCMISLIYYAIVKRRLMGIKAVIQLGIIYTILLAVVVSFYLTLIFILGLILKEITNTTIIVSAGLTTIVGIFGVPPLKRYFQKVTDKLFFKDEYDYFQAIEELSKILSKNIEPKHIVDKVSSHIKHIFKVEKIDFMLRSQTTIPDDIKWFHVIKHIQEMVVHYEIPYLLQDAKLNQYHRNALLTIQELGKINNVAVTVPIILENETISILQMGKKLSGDPYTNKDLKLLKTISYQAAVALCKANFYEELKDYSLKLEERVKQRTVQIEQFQETQKQTMIDISHGLQAPLTIMKGNLGFLKEQMSGNKNFNALEKSIDEISTFIYDLLNLANMETGQDEFMGEQVNLSKLLNNLVEYYNTVVQDKHIAVISYIEPSIIISGRKNKLEELVTNLVSNAVKYISNQRKIYIDLHKVDTAVELTIKDTGIGISKEDLPYIFDRFYRMKSSRHPEIKGTGLGLTICKKIIEKHGGTIRVESELGKGTKFIVRFPIEKNNTL